MCIAIWVWEAHPVYQLILLLNRDEFHSRPTEAAGWWGEGDEKVLGGKDGKAGGTWLGCTRDGRLAFLTNFRDPGSLPSAKSRGDLPVKFLQSKQSPLEFAEEIIKEADQYNGFNLVVCDLCLKTMVYISNRPKGEPPSIQLVSPDLHVLSNAILDSPWDKAQRLSNGFEKLLTEYREEVPLKEMVEKLMRDSTKADKERLPNTGYDPEWELQLSSIFIDIHTQLGRYGTRSTAALAVKLNGEVTFYETYLESGVWKEHTIQYHIEKAL